MKANRGINKTLLLFPKGQLSAGIKMDVERAGFIAVEVADPSSVQMLLPSVERIKSDVLLEASLMALGGANSDPERIKFAWHILNYFTVALAQKK